MKEIPVEVLWYGQDETLAEPVILKSGPLQITYEPGLIRNIKIGEHEVLRMVYFAVRDHNWGTIRPVIKNQSLIKHEDSFDILFDCHYDIRGIRFVFHAKIRGNKKGQITFWLDGRALADFKTNRIGFCVLHPIQECRGKPCEITTPQGDRHIEKFPDLICPYQPMQNISGMAWDVDKNVSATINFEGDIFEMEDQRNWSDDSYKTYCRPLALPFPYLLRKGDQVQQKITFSINLRGSSIYTVEDDYHFNFNVLEELKLPEVGTGKSSLRSNLSAGEIELLRKIEFDFYEFDLEFKTDWKSKLHQVVREARELGYKLSLKVHFSYDYEKEISLVSNALGASKSLVCSILILDQQSIVPSDNSIAEISKRLRKAFPATRIGAGTIGFFADLNRNRICMDAIDFMSYSINPQVHAFDNLSLVENLHGQGETLETARTFAEGKEIHIKPVSLRMQVNPAANSVEDSAKNESEKIDARQMSLFGAAWTLGSLKNLIQAGASSITFYETVGEKGIIQGDRDPLIQGNFHAGKNAIFPMFYVFNELLRDKTARYIKSYSSHPTIFDGIVLNSGGKKVILLANFTGKQITVKLDKIESSARIKKLDEKNAISALYHHDQFLNSPFCELKITQSTPAIRLRPYGIVIVKE